MANPRPGPQPQHDPTAYVVREQLITRRERIYRHGPAPMATTMTTNDVPATSRYGYGYPASGRPLQLGQIQTQTPTPPPPYLLQEHGYGYGYGHGHGHGPSPQQIQLEYMRTPSRAVPTSAPATPGPYAPPPPPGDGYLPRHQVEHQPGQIQPSSPAVPSDPEYVARRRERIARGYSSPYRGAGVDADLAREDRQAELQAAHQARLGREGGRKSGPGPTPGPASVPGFRILDAERYESRDPLGRKIHAAMDSGYESPVHPRTLPTRSHLSGGENLRSAARAQNAAVDGSNYSLPSHQATVGSAGAADRRAALPKTGIKHAHGMEKNHSERLAHDIEKWREETHEERKRKGMLGTLGESSAGLGICDGGNHRGGPWQQGMSMGPPQRVRFLGNSSTSQETLRPTRMITGPTGLIGQTRENEGSTPESRLRMPAPSEATFSTTGTTPSTPSNGIDSITRSFYAPQENRGPDLVFRDRIDAGVEARARSALEQQTRTRMNATVESVRDSDEYLIEERFRGLRIREETRPRAESRDRAYGRMVSHGNSFSQMSGNSGSAMQWSAGRSRSRRFE